MDRRERLMSTLLSFPTPCEPPSSTSSKMSSSASPDERRSHLGDKLQRLAMQQPSLLQYVERLVDKWLQEERSA